MYFNPGINILFDLTEDMYYASCCYKQEYEYISLCTFGFQFDIAYLQLFKEISPHSNRIDMNEVPFALYIQDISNYTDLKV